MRRVALSILVGLFLLPLISLTETRSGQVKKATFVELVYDSAVDENGDGYFEYLDFGINVKIAEPHARFVCGALLSEDGSKVISSGSHAFSPNPACCSVADTASGLVDLRLRFSGHDILSSGRDGRYRLQLGIKKVAAKVTEDTVTYQATNSYDFTRFREMWVGPDHPLSDKGVDDNSDGKYEYLEASFPVRFLEPAEYQIVGQLNAPDSTTIATIETTLDLSENDGIRSEVHTGIRFDGKTVFESGYDGPYQLRVTLLRTGKVISAMDFKTSVYSHAEFGESN